MCATCGCGGNGASIEHLHDHDHPHDPFHPHDHAHPHDRPHPHGHPHARAHEHHHAPSESSPASGGGEGGGSVVDIETRILAKNDALAQKNRGWFAGREILALNLVSSPGAGKTTLLERTIADLRRELPLFVIEGDQASAIDAERIRAGGAPVVQVNTGTGCHLDAGMIAGGLAQLRPDPGAVVLIENVGNLVCPALFDLGEHAKVVLFSVTEGEEKPIKYPHMFRAAGLVVLNKIDLLPYLDFAVDRAVANLRVINPDAPVLMVSARTGEGLAPWYDWLRQQTAAARAAAFA